MQKIHSNIDTYREYILELQKNMTCRPAVSPELGGKGEYAKSVYLEGELKKLKFDEIYHLDAPDARAEKGIRPNIVAKYYGQDKTKTLWILAHMDVVPEGERSLWKTDPFEMVLDADGDTIYGRGVEDNQQAVTAAFLTARAIMEAGVRPPVNLGIMLLADEEVGNEYGMQYVLKTKPDVFGKDDVFVVQDSGEPEGKEVEIAEKNVFWFKFTTTGKQCHGSMPDSGNNAFTAGAHLVIRLRDGLYAKFDRKDPLFAPDKSTFEPTRKEANVPNINTIPGVDVFCMDCRFLPSYNPKDVQAEVARIVKTVEDDFKVQVKVEVVHHAASFATPQDCKLVKLYCEAVEKLNNVKPKILGVGGGTFAAEVRNLGLAAVVGSKIYGEPHVPNEKASVKFTMADAKVITYVLMNYK